MRLTFFRTDWPAFYVDRYYDVDVYPPRQGFMLHVWRYVLAVTYKDAKFEA